MRRFAFSWSALAIVALAAVTALVAIAAIRASSPGSGEVPGPTASALTNPPTISDKSGESGDGRAPDVEPPLALVDRDTAYRGTVGSCLGGSTLERTVDGGSSWTPVDSPVAALTDIEATSSTGVTAVGADESCGPALWSSSTAGRRWNGPGSTAGRWYRLPETTKSIQTPVGSRPSPCPDRSLAVREIEGLDASVGVLLCPEGAVFASADGGATWTQRSVVDGAVALSWETAQEGKLLVRGGETCPGFQLLRSIDGGATWQTGGCVGDASATTLQSTSPSLDFVDTGTGMAALDGAVFITTDGGLNWRLSTR